MNTFRARVASDSGLRRALLCGAALSGITALPSAAFAQDATLALVGPMAEYKLYVADETQELVKDTRAFTDAVNKAKPSGAKGKYVEKIALSSTQGKGVKVDPATALGA